MASEIETRYSKGGLVHADNKEMRNIPKRLPNIPKLFVVCSDKINEDEIHYFTTSNIKDSN